MLQRWSPLTASLILGVIWGVWHLPAFFLSGLPQAQFSLPLFLVGTVVLSVVAAWILVRSGGSVLLTIMFHLSVNFSGSRLGVPFSVNPATIAVWAVIVVLAGGLGRPTGPGPMGATGAA